MPVLRNIGELATCRADGGQAEIHAVSEAALAWRDGQILWLGPEADLPFEPGVEESFDAGGRLVVPGLVDCHTHLAFAGWRAGEFEQRILGRSYLEIAEAGGGILSTVRATRAASQEDLQARSRLFLDEMLALGVTTVECKSGYGLSLEEELKQLARCCDVFLERSAFTWEEARRILEAGNDAGLLGKLHADQLTDGGGAGLAAEAGAVSADHLECISEGGIRALAEAGVVAVSLPIATLYLNQEPMPARRLIDAGAAVAVATDFNPGSAPSYHLPFAMTLACNLQRMTPAEVLKGATIYAARAIGLEDRVGSLEPGKAADFAVIDAPDVDHWLYHLRPNACVATVIGGDLRSGSLSA
ncbi:MAG: amidohydrolase family protein [Gemmatimonadales bacterium]